METSGVSAALRTMACLWPVGIGLTGVAYSFIVVPNTLSHHKDPCNRRLSGRHGETA